MRFTKIGVERGDCTCAYKVDGYNARTVREFIDEVLHERPQDFGHIAVGGVFVFHPSCEYRYGKLLSTLSDDLLDKCIVRVDADGDEYVVEKECDWFIVGTKRYYYEK